MSYHVHMCEYLYMICYMMCDYVYIYLVMYHDHERCQGHCVTICQFAFLLQGL